MFEFSVDPRLIYAERVKGRHTIYLDTNAWSDLSEHRSADARQAYAWAVAAHVTGATTFPLAYATITEIFKRDANPDSERQMDLMDRLSRGVSLRGDRHVRELEALCAFQFMTEGRSEPRTSEMFTVLWCYARDQELPAQGIARNTGDAILRIAYPTLRWLHSAIRTPEFLQHERDRDDRYVRQISEKVENATTWATDASGKLDAKKLRFEEHTAAISHLLEILPRLVNASAVLRVMRQFDDTVREPAGPRAAAAVVGAMPSIALSCEMHVQRTLARAKTKRQDYYDHEHAAMAIPYVDAFVTSDRALLDVLRRSKVFSRYPCRIISGMNALAEYLQNLNVS